MRLNHVIISASVLGLGFSSAAPLAHSAAGDLIGSAMLVENRVTADLARETRTLVTGDSVRQDELIEVARDARSELVLTDDTRLALGPGARLKLDRFVYDPGKKAGSIAVSLAKGTLRWVTGLARKPTYVIRVPNASITVRGTIFDLYVTDAGVTWALLHEGAIQVCNDRGECRVHEEPCKLVRVAEGGDVGRPARFADIPGASEEQLPEAFPFVVTPPAITAGGPTCSKEAILRVKDASAPRPAPPSKPVPRLVPRFEPPVLRKAERTRPRIIKPLFVPDEHAVDIIPAPPREAPRKKARPVIVKPKLEKPVIVELPRPRPRPPMDRYEPSYAETPRVKPHPIDPSRWKDRYEEQKKRYTERKKRWERPTRHDGDYDDERQRRRGSKVNIGKAITGGVIAYGRKNRNKDGEGDY